MDDERKRNPYNGNFKYNKKGSKYRNRKLLYIVLIIFIVINLFLIPFRIEEDFTNLVNNNNNNNKIENQINSNSNNPPTPLSTQTKQDTKIENTKNENKINDNTKNKW